VCVCGCLTNRLGTLGPTRTDPRVWLKIKKA
jgi:hypothetical protein